MNNYQSLIRDIPDFPRKGILFKDITPLLQSADAFKQVVKDMSEPFANESLDSVVSVEARGYIFGAAVAYQLGIGFTPVRKLGKLPWETAKIEYSLEYGSSTLEIHTDALRPGQRVLLVDDVLATGGTLRATISLVEQAGVEIVGIVVLAELVRLQGAKTLSKYRLVSLLHL